MNSDKARAKEQQSEEIHVQNNMKWTPNKLVSSCFINESPSESLMSIIKLDQMNDEENKNNTNQIELHSNEIQMEERCIIKTKDNQANGKNFIMVS